MRLDELSFEIRLERRTTKGSSSGMRPVPVFILETHNQTNYKCLSKFVQSDNASSSILNTIKRNPENDVEVKGQRSSLRTKGLFGQSHERAVKHTYTGS